MLGKAETPDDPLKHAQVLTVIQRRRRNLIIVHEGEGLPVVQRVRRIDIWWRGHRSNIGLMLALAFLLRKHEVWADADVIIWRIVERANDVASATSQVNDVLARAQFAAGQDDRRY